MISLSLCYLTDGTTTLNLMDNVSYGLVSFSPVIAPLQESELAAGGPYLPVAQPLTINIFGGTQAACWDNATRLLTLLDQANRWQNDLPVNAVRLVVQTHTANSAVESYILGQTGDDDPLATLEPELDQGVPNGRFVLRGVTLSVLRTGVWEGAIEATITSTIATNPAVMTSTLASATSNYSRIRLSMSKSGGDGAIRSGNFAYILLASSSSKILVADSVGFSTPAGTSNVADAGADALGGSVKRIQANTTEVKISIAVSAFTQRRAAIYAAVRNNSATTTFYVRGEVTDSGVQAPNRTPYNEIDTSTTLPRIIYLGMVTARYDQAPAGVCNLYISASQTSAPQTLDIDYAVVQSLDDPFTDRTIVTGSTLSSAGALANVVIDPGSSILRTPYPVLLVNSTSTPYTEPYAGDIYTVVTGGGFATLILTTNGDTFWRLRDGGVAIQMGVTSRRTQAYRTPPGGTAP